MKCSLLCALVVFAVVEVRGELIIDSDTTIDYALDEPGLEITIADGADPPTVVDVVEPARIVSNVFSVADSSVLNVFGGELRIDVEDGYALYPKDTSTVNIYGGEIVGVAPGGSSTLNIFEGNIIIGVSIRESSTVNILGGSIPGVANPMSGTVNIFGGTIEAFGGTRFTIYGTDFNYPYGEIPDSSGTLTGILKNGDPINARFSGSIVLMIPEPSSLILLLTCAAGSAGYALRLRKRSGQGPRESQI